MSTISNAVEKIIRIAAGVLLIVLSANVFIQVLSRQVFRIPTVWTDEIARFSFIWMTMLGAALQVKHKSHYAVSMFIYAIKNQKTLKIIHIVIYILMLCLALTLVWYGIEYSITGYGRYSTSIEIRMIWIFSAIPVGGLLMSFFLIQLIVDECMSKNIQPEEDDK